MLNRTSRESARASGACSLSDDPKQPEPILEKITDAKTRKGYELWFGEPTLIGIQNRAAQIEVRMDIPRHFSA